MNTKSGTLDDETKKHKQGTKNIVSFIATTVLLNISFILASSAALDERIYGKYLSTLSLTYYTIWPAIGVIIIMSLITPGIKKIRIIVWSVVIGAIIFTSCWFLLDRQTNPEVPPAHGSGGLDTRSFLQIQLQPRDRDHDGKLTTPDGEPWSSSLNLQHGDYFAVDFKVINNSEEIAIEDGEISIRLIPRPGGQVLISGELRAPGFTPSQSYATVFSDDTIPVRIDTSKSNRIRVFSQNEYDENEFIRTNRPFSKMTGETIFNIDSIDIEQDRIAHYRIYPSLSDFDQ